MRRSVQNVTLDPCDPQKDRELLSVWLHRKHVSRWWGDPEKILSEGLVTLSDGECAFIAADGEPVGYLQWGPVDRDELDEVGLTEIPDGSIDIDIMIGEPEYLGCNIGPRALKLLLTRLRQDPSIPMISLAVSLENPSAIRAYEKAGFEPLREFEDHKYGRMQVMIAP